MSLYVEHMQDGVSLGPAQPSSALGFAWIELIAGVIQQNKASQQAATDAFVAQQQAIAAAQASEARSRTLTAIGVSVGVIGILGLIGYLTYRSGKK